MDFLGVGMGWGKGELWRNWVEDHVCVVMFAGSGTGKYV